MNIFAHVAFYQVLGLPLIVYGGIVTLVSLLMTLSLPVLGKKGLVKNHFVWHVRFAILTAILAFFHGLLGILATL